MYLNKQSGRNKLLAVVVQEEYDRFLDLISLSIRLCCKTHKGENGYIRALKSQRFSSSGAVADG